MALNLLLAAAAGAAIWALSPFLTGHLEPWDSNTPYYVVALLGAGFLLGSFRPRRVWTHAVGIFLGQLIYALAALPAGPLIVVGVGFLAIYSLICWGGAGLGSWLRRKLDKKSGQKLRLPNQLP